MILLTGDTHRFHDIEKLERLKYLNLSYKDYLIILGDAGIIWNDDIKTDECIIQWYRENVDCTVLFVDGNHCNFNALNKMEVTQWNGGNIHKISDQIFHLMRGQIFNIDGKSFFTMGGGFSVDKDRRIDRISWWKEEMPNSKETKEGMRNLNKNKFKVDYILTHECPGIFVDQVIPDWAKKMFGHKEPTKLNYYFSSIYNIVKFNKWYFGHYHNDIKVNNHMMCIYKDIIELGD